MRLVTHIFTKYLQNVGLINTHILIYWHARCQCKLWNPLWFYYIFLSIFIHYYWPLSEFLYVHQTFLHTNISTCQMSQQVIEWFYSVFANLAHNWRIFMSEVLYPLFIPTKLLRIVFLINTFILICWNAKCNYKLQKVPF